MGFVDASEIPTTFFDAPYYAGPDGPVSEKPYALLRQVLRDTGKVGLAKVVLRDREDLVAVLPLENGIVLQKAALPGGDSPASRKYLKSKARKDRQKGIDPRHESGRTDDHFLFRHRHCRSLSRSPAEID